MALIGPTQEQSPVQNIGMLNGIFHGTVRSSVDNKFKFHNNGQRDDENKDNKKQQNSYHFSSQVSCMSPQQRAGLG